jgi:hypothetical protein
MASQAAVHKKKRKDGRPFNPGGRKNLELRMRENQALDLRLKGYSYDDIAAKMKMTDIGIYTMIMRVLARMEEELKEKIPQVRQMELRRCDMMLKALEKGVKRGDTKSIATALKVSDRRARLLGLDAPVKVNPVDGEGRTMDLAVFRTIVLAAEVAVDGLDGVPAMKLLDGPDWHSVN